MTKFSDNEKYDALASVYRITFYNRILLTGDSGALMSTALLKCHLEVNLGEIKSFLHPRPPLNIL